VWERAERTWRQGHVVPSRLDVGVAEEGEEGVRGYLGDFEDFGEEVELEREVLVRV
jgi:hypothetical protein